VQKNVTTTISNNLNLDVVATNSKAQSKVHKNIYNKHQNKSATIECNSKVFTVNTINKMQHQNIAIKQKIHVHQIPKTTTPECKSAQCFKDMIIIFLHNDDVKKSIRP
jgi:hypothetical protein